MHYHAHPLPNHLKDLNKICRILKDARLFSHETDLGGFDDL